MMNVLILAGGKGSRLWPLSQQDLPKQFHSLCGPLSLLQKTILRYSSWPNLSTITVLIHRDHRQICEHQIQQLSLSSSVDILEEPERRNTMAAIAFGIASLQKNLDREDAPILITPSDHLVGECAPLQQAVSTLAPSLSTIVLFGILPRRPETGYGYIRMGPALDSLLYRVDSFEEKPSLERATLFIKNPAMVWNSGMLLLSPRIFWEEVAKHAPEFSIRALDSFSKLPNRSIDYALLEKSNTLSVCPLSISWSDVGSWESLYELFEKDSNQNVKQGNVREYNTKNSLIMGRDKPICAIGLNDLLIVDTEHALLVCKKGESHVLQTLLRDSVQ